MEQVEDFFGQLEAADAQSAPDTPQLTADVEIDRTSDETDTTELSETSVSTIQSPEDVMSAYVEAFKNLDFEAMGSLMIGSAREGFEETRGKGFSVHGPRRDRRYAGRDASDA